MEKQTADQQSSKEKRRPVVVNDAQEHEEFAEQSPYDYLYRSPSVQAQAETVEGLPTMTQRQDAVSHIGRVQGNRHVQRLVGAVRARRKSTTTVQPKLTVGEPDDLYEEEADRTAEAVMRMSAPAVPPSSEEEEDLQSVSEGVQTSGVGIPKMTPELEGEVNGLRGTGRPLPSSERDFFESRMQADFSGVRVHTDETATRTTKDLQAKAYTVGSDVVFGAGEYQPGTEAGRKLLAHELTHVVQQGAAGKLQPKRVEALQRSAVIQAPVPQVKEEEEDDEGPVGPPPPEVVAEQKAQESTPEQTGEAQSAPPETAGAEQTQPAVAPLSPVAKEGEAADSTPSTPEAKSDELQGNGAAPPSEAGAQAVEEVAEELPDGPAGVEVEAAKGEAPPTKGQDVEGAAEAGGEKGAGESAASGEPKAAAGPEEGTAPVEEKGAAETEGAVAPAADVAESAPEPAAPAEEAAAPEQAAPELQEQAAELKNQKGEAEQSVQEADAQAQEAVSSLESEASAQVNFAPSPDTEKGQAQAASEKINQFISRNSQRASSVLASTQDVQPRFTAISEQIKAQIRSAMQLNLQNVRGVIATARQQVLTKATQAEGEIVSLYDTTAAEIEQTALQALAEVDSEHQTKLQELESLGTTTAQDVEDRFTQAQTDVRTAGQTVAGQADTRRDAGLSGVITPYQGKEGDIWEGKNYYKKKITAAENAADGVVQGYKDEFEEQAEATAQQLPQGKQDVLATAHQKLEVARSAIDAEHTRATQAIEDSRVQSLEAARQTKEQNLTSVRQSKTQALSALTQLRAKLVAQLQSTSAQQILVIEQSARKAIADVRAGSAQVAQQLHQAIQQLGAQMQGAPAPDPEALSQALASSQAQFDGVMAQLQAQLSARLVTSEQALRVGGQQAVAGVTQVAEEGNNLVDPIVQEFVTGADTMVEGATLSLNETRDKHVEAVDKESQEAITSIGEAYTQAEMDVQDVKTALNQGLTDFVTDFHTGPEGLTKSLDKLEDDVRVKAQEAADKVLPRWKSVAAFVGKLIVSIVVAIAIAAVVAVALASGGWVALLLGALAAGAIGAIGGVAKGMIDNAAQGKALFTKDLWVEAGIGAIEGVLAFAGGAAAGKLIKLARMSKVWRVVGEKAVDLVTDTLSTVSNMLIKGDFTWAGLGLSLAESLVFSFLGDFAGKKMTGRRADADLTPSARIAKDQDLPDAPFGYEWATTGRKAVAGSTGSADDVVGGVNGMYLRRTRGRGPEGANVREAHMNWEKGRIEFESPNRPRGERFSQDGLPAGKENVRDGWKKTAVGKAVGDTGKELGKAAEDAWLPGGSSDQHRQRAGLENQAADLAEDGVEEGQSWDWEEDWEEYQKQKQP